MWKSFPPNISCRFWPSISTKNTALISLFRGAYYDFLSHPLKESQNAGRNSWLKPWETNLKLLTGMTRLTAFRALPWWMLVGIPLTVTHCHITVWGAMFSTAPTVNSPYSLLCGWGWTFGYFRDGILNAYTTANEQPEIYTTGTIEPSGIKYVFLYGISIWWLIPWPNILPMIFTVLVVSPSVWHEFDCVCSAGWMQVTKQW